MAVGADLRAVFQKVRRNSVALLALGVALCSALSGHAAHAAAAAGAVISNTAYVSYTGSPAGTVTNLASNTVTAVVSQVASFTLTSSQSRLAPVNTSVYFFHTVTNTGNGADTFDLSAVAPAASCVTCAPWVMAVALYADMAPSDGVPDNATPVTSTGSLAAGQSFNFIAVATVPASATATQGNALDVKAAGKAATATAGGYTAAAQKINTDTVTVTSGGLLTPVGKTYSTSFGPSPSASSITVTLTYTNNSTATVSNVRITDWIGQTNTSPVLDTTGLRYKADSARWSSCTMALTDRSSDGYECGATGTRIDFQVVYPNAPSTAAARVEALIESVPPNTSATLKFDVDVISGLAAGSALTTNAARITYCDLNQTVCPAGRTLSLDTNQVAYTVVPVRSAVDLVVTNSVTSPASGGFTVNAPGEYTVQVKNIGDTTSSGLVTVTESLAGGMQVGSISAPGWTCTTSGSHLNVTGSTVTCTSSIPIPAQTGSTPGLAQPIRITVTPRELTGVLTLLPPLPASANVSSTATVAGGGEPAANTGNNTSTVITTVRRPAGLSGRVWLDGNHDKAYGAVSPDLPLANWIVEVIDLASTAVITSGTTVTDGTYTLTGVVPGTYGLRFRDPNGGMVDGTPACQGAGTCTVDTSRSLLKITLAPGDTSINLNLPLDPTGIVYDGDTGAAIAGAKVNITVRAGNGSAATGFSAAAHLVGGAATLTQTTGATGFYQFIVTPAGAAFCGGLPGGGCLFTLDVVPPAGYQAFSVSKALRPPNASQGGCLASANCIDPTGLANPHLVSTINVAPIVPVNQPYFLGFLLNVGDPDVVNNHFPLFKTGAAAAAAGTNLLVTKSANKATAEIGDFVDYTVRVFNGTAAAANNVIVRDVLPAGFKYVAGSVRLTTPPAGPASIITPAGGAGPALDFAAGVITAGATVTLTYRAQLSLNAPRGDGVNRVSASAAGFNSNTATARVRVLEGVFSSRGYIIGTVFLDCNRDRLQGERELGIPGVRLYMEDGSYVITDVEGKFSLYGVTPRTHVLKVDSITLPRGAELIALANRNAGDPGSRFVDVKNGEMARADFAEGSCAPAVLDEVKARRAKGETGQAELNRAYGGALGQTPAQLVSGGVANPLATGSIAGSAAQPQLGGPAGGQPGGLLPDLSKLPQLPQWPYGTPSSAGAQVFQPVTPPGTAGGPQAGLTAGLTAGNSNLPSTSAGPGAAQLPDVAQAPASQPLEDVLPGLDNTLAILDLKDGDTMLGSVTNVRVKGQLGSAFTLSVNGVDVPATRIGKRSSLESKAVQAWEYIGVSLKPGENLVVAQQIDQFGNVRGETRLKLIAPGTLGKIIIETVATAPADGSTPVTVKVRLTDDQGVLVTSRTGITLESTAGRWLVKDLNPLEAGVQVFISGGEATYTLAAPADPGDANITVSGGVLRATRKLAFLPHLRPLVAAGVIEGAINLNGLSLKNLSPPRERDSFEQEIRRFQYESSGGNLGAGARAALFLKGQIKGDYLLTLAYDSDKDIRERVFRDISPDEFYPVYGDSSARGYDGQTSGRMYIRVDKGKSFLLYGDYATGATNPARMLSQFSRTLTGAKLHAEGAPYAVNGFVSRDTFRQIAQEFAANGTSGPFLLNLPSGSVINSEKVEILTRDRNQPALIIKSEPQGRFADYEIETYTGRLLFKGPVAGLDANLNPRSIRIIYELDQGGTPFWIAGVDGQYKLTDSVEIGGALVKDQNPGQEFTMAGLNATWKIFEKTILTVEGARTSRNAPAVTAGTASGAMAGSGNAKRAELRHTDGNLDVRVYGGRADTAFDNPGSNLNRGRLEAGGRAGYKLTPSTTLSVEMLRTGDVDTGARRDAMQLRAEHAFASGIRVEAGVRSTSESTPATPNGASLGATPNEFTSIRGKVTLPVPYVPQASVYGEAEQAIKGDERKQLAVGGEYKLSNSMRLYGRHEMINSVTGGFGLTPAQKNTTTVFGLDTKVAENTQVFSEYRGRSSFDGATAEASMGVRNTWPIADGLRVTGTLERLQPIQRLANATVSNESTAVTGGVEYTANPLWKGSARLELRSSTATDSVLNTLSGAYKLSESISLLARSTYSITQQKGATPGAQERWRVQAGAAYRSSSLSALARLEHREESDTVTAPAMKRAVELASVHFNYQPSRAVVMSGRYAGKLVSDSSADLVSRSAGHLVSGRLTYDVTSRIDASIIGAIHTDGLFRGGKFAAGFEMGYMLYENLWVSAGVNLSGFRDLDLAGQDYLERGTFIRLRYKFDESVFDWARDSKLRHGETKP